MGRSVFGSVGGPIQQSVLPLIVKVDDQVNPIGSCFIVNAGGLFMTAAHVLTTANSYASRRFKDGRFYNHLEFYAVYVTDKANQDTGTFLGGLLPVQNMWAPEDLDVGFGYLKLPYNTVTGKLLEVAPFILRPAPPRPNEIVRGIGYHTMTAEFTQHATHYEMTYHQDTAVEEGKVLKVFEERRDSGLMSFPCFSVEAKFDHGMSGGPILDVSGRVCGVITGGSSWENSSWGSLIWPVFGARIGWNGQTASQDGSSLILDLVREGLIGVDDSIERVAVQLLENGDRTVVLKS